MTLPFLLTRRKRHLPIYGRSPLVTFSFALSPFGNVSTLIQENDIDYIVNASSETLREMKSFIAKECANLLGGDQA